MIYIFCLPHHQRAFINNNTNFVFRNHQKNELNSSDRVFHVLVVHYTIECLLEIWKGDVNCLPGHKCVCSLHEACLVFRRDHMLTPGKNPPWLYWEECQVPRIGTTSSMETSSTFHDPLIDGSNG